MNKDNSCHVCGNTYLVEGVVRSFLLYNVLHVLLHLLTLAPFLQLFYLDFASNWLLVVSQSAFLNLVLHVGLGMSIIIAEKYRLGNLWTLEMGYGKRT